MRISLRICGYKYRKQKFSGKNPGKQANRNPLPGQHICLTIHHLPKLLPRHADRLQKPVIPDIPVYIDVEDIVDDMEDKLRAGPINRLANNLCNVRSGVRYLDTLTNLERISDHAMNIAQVVINESRKVQHFHEVTE